MPKRRVASSAPARNYLQRPADRFEPRQRFLIVCEGERTEPGYFRGFRAPGLVMDIRGLGVNTIQLVERAQELASEQGYDQVWCVFDRDSFPAGDFNRAIVLAASHGIHVAYSNQAFELWYLLHFNFYATAMLRADYVRKLSELLGHPYTKNSPSIFRELLSEQATATKHARQLLQQYPTDNPAQNDPSTTVHLLVEQLNKSGPYRVTE